MPGLPGWISLRNIVAAGILLLVLGLSSGWITSAEVSAVAASLTASLITLTMIVLADVLEFLFNVLVPIGLLSALWGLTHLARGNHEAAMGLGVGGVVVVALKAFGVIAWFIAQSHLPPPFGHLG